MERPSDSTRGWALIKVTGPQPTKALDKCAQDDLNFWGAYPEDEFTITLKTRIKDAQKVCSYADKCSCEIEILEIRGAPIFVKRLRGRYVLWAFPLVILMLITFASLFVWRIEIEGDVSVSDIEILNALERSGVYIGSFWPPFVSDNIRSRVLLEIPELKWISVSTFGSVVRVEVFERTPIPDILNEDERVKIVADTAGIIEEMRVLRGHSDLSRGEAVLPGDVLISGIAHGRHGPTGLIRAIGSVRARTWHEISAIMPLEYNEMVFTGQERTRFALIIGKNRINFFRGSGILDPGYDSIMINRVLEIDGLLTLPISIMSIRSAQFEPSPSRVSENEARNTLETLLHEELKRRIGDTGEIVFSEFTFSMSGSTAIGTLRAECIQYIGVEERLSEEEIAQFFESLEPADEAVQ